MFGYVKLIKNTDPYKYSYSGYGNGFDSHSIFSLPNFDWGKNVIGVNISFSVDVDNIYINIYVIYIYINFGEWPTQRLDNTALTAEIKYSINFTQSNTKFYFNFTL